MTQWTPAELELLAGVRELDIATERADGTVRSFVPIWVVRIGDDLYVRSWRGRGGSWFNQVLRHPRAHIRVRGLERAITLEEADPGLRTEMDRAYRAKYGTGMYADAMVEPSAAAAALKIVP